VKRETVEAFAFVTQTLPSAASTSRRSEPRAVAGRHSVGRQIDAEQASRIVVRNPRRSTVDRDALAARADRDRGDPRTRVGIEPDDVAAAVARRQIEPTAATT
jgi:hypothetical protein